jgi:Tol biopolymer transport system component
MYLPTIRYPDPCAATAMPSISLPPTQERIVFFHSNYQSPPGTTPDLYLTNADNTARTRLTNDSATESRATWSPDGTRIAYTSRSDASVSLKLLRLSDRRITTLHTWPIESFIEDPAWSPDGKQIAFTISPSSVSGSYIGAIQVNGNNLRILTNTGADRQPSWAPDGSRIVFSSARGGINHLYVMQADGTNQTQLTDQPIWDYEPAWSPDGSRIAFTSGCIGAPGGGHNSIYVIQADGSGRIKIPTPAAVDGGAYDSQTQASWSPDGKRIVYTQSFFKGTAMYIVNLDGSGYSELGSSLDSAPSWAPR